MKINEKCSCGSEMFFDTDTDLKKDWKKWTEAHSNHNPQIEPRIKGMTSAISTPVDRKFDGLGRYTRVPVVFGFVPNEVNEMMNHE